MDEIMPLRTPFWCLTILCACVATTASAADPKPERVSRPSSFKELIGAKIARKDSPSSAKATPGRGPLADQAAEISPVSFKELVDVPPSPDDPPQQVRSPHGTKADRIAELSRLDQFSLMRQTSDEARAKSWSCVECHKNCGDMHKPNTLNLGCVDCHGGDATTTNKWQAHVQPRFPEVWASTGNPVRSYTVLNHECPEFIRFVNPGDLRIAHLSCGTSGCHPRETLEVKKSMMTHGCMLWGAALYNNGAIPSKRSRYGESYSMNGTPQRLQTVPAPSEWEMKYKGVVPFLDPLPRFEISHPGNVLRIFERGGRFRTDVGVPTRDEEPGRPRTRLSNRGLGTENRTDPVFVGLTKTRLLDPTLNFLGTNDHPGDYRSSGCTACHVIYANDRSPVHSGPYASAGNRSLTLNPDPTIPKDEPGHPIRHEFTTAIPTSQCIVCHMHPGTTVLQSYTGMMWWDNETDGELMYPEHQKTPTAEEFVRSAMNNPEEGSLRGKWSDPEFLAQTADLNPQLKHMQFADFHGHGWVFRSVFKRDREGHLLDHKGKIIEDETTAKLNYAMLHPDCRVEKDGMPVHFMDIHLEKGMHCIDCHFKQDNHGNTKLYGEVRAAIEITCEDCHGTAYQRATLRTSGPAAPDKSGSNPMGGTDLTLLSTPSGKPRFRRVGGPNGKIIQTAMVEKNGDQPRQWEVPQVIDTITPGHPRYNEKSHLAKTVRFEGDQITWGDKPKDPKSCAHDNKKMSCASCHSSWNPSCYGCHLKQRANMKMPGLHNDGDVSRNYTSYNFQTLRDDVYMLAKDSTVTGNRINPVRSACAVHVSSYNNNRESIYVQQQTISADGLSGIAFSTNVPHTVRGKDGTKQCNDCHLSKAEDNNAIMAQLLMHGTNYTNWIGQYCWVGAGEHGMEAVVVTERDEPQAVIGSTLHKLAFPEQFQEHCERGGEIEHAHEHPGHDVADRIKHPFRKANIQSLQHRGEYIYAACGEAGFRVFDIAFIDHKGFAERITTAHVSPFGQRFYVPTCDAAAVAAPSTTAPDPTRKQHPENEEQAVHLLYAFIYVADRQEGLILVGAGTLLDGDPTNNFLERALTFNPNGVLTGARAITIVGTYAYICADVGLVVVDLNDPKNPRVESVIGAPFLNHPNAVQVQFRYAFVADNDGLKVLDITNLASPEPKASLHLHEARNVYVARTYAYVSGGHEGLIIVDVKNPLEPKVDQIYNANGCIGDLNDVKLGITCNSEFAYLADGHNGMHVVQLTNADTPGTAGFATRPTPQLIATRKLPKDGHAVCISEGVDRDRAVDESGNQLSVFGRIGARPFNLEEQRRLYMHNGQVWKITSDPKDPSFLFRSANRELKTPATVRR